MVTGKIKYEESCNANVCILSCIEKWLKGSGNSCPNCNEKNTRRDIRVHFVSKLAAIDTSERDRALLDLEKEMAEKREVQLRLTELNVRLKLQQDKIQQLESDNRSVSPCLSMSLDCVPPQEVQREGRRADWPEPGHAAGSQASDEFRTEGSQAGGKWRRRRRRKAGTEVGLREETRGLPAQH